MRLITLSRRLALCLIAVLPAAPVSAQRAVEPEILVNEQAITGWEIEQRATLLDLFGAGGDTRELARTQLIDDRLKMGVVARLELEPSEDAIDAAVQDFADRREIPVDALIGVLAQRGVDEVTLRNFLEVQISWRDAVQAIFRNRARPSEQDLDTALNYSDSGIEESVLLQELSLSVEKRGEAEATELARRLSRELNRGGNFNAAVARYSDSPSAQRGGRLDWMPASELPPQLAGQILALMPGEVSAPVPVRGGLSIFKLRDIRQQARTVDDSAADMVTFIELIQSLPANATDNAILSARVRAQKLRDEADTCTELEEQAAEFDLGSGRSEPTPIGALPSALADRLVSMESGQSQILTDARGVVLLMLCARSGEASAEDRETLRLRIFNERMNNFAQGFLQELRGDAVIVEQ